MTGEFSVIDHVLRGVTELRVFKQLSLEVEGLRREQTVLREENTEL
ncbi:uncharacterized protein G2W53_022583 [Senna tora]|uniref:Uncharacterized protein n=1 Tax=Senna tora TaxID=362788 RepID=A0A834TN66_9FABA|nr:uncharacterized protein G2W53_022583 [Senna tora]